MQLGSTVQSVGKLSAGRHLAIKSVNSTHRHLINRLLRLSLKRSDSCKALFAQLKLWRLHWGVHKHCILLLWWGWQAKVHHSYIARVQLLLGVLQGVPVLICSAAASVLSMRHSSAMP